MSFKIYTKTGDDGSTSLFGGKRVKKYDLQVESYGTLDELNAHLGLLSDFLDEAKLTNKLYKIQNQLFDISSHLASENGKASFLPKIEESIILDLELQIDEWETQLEPLKNFILPGGDKTISQCHVCRCVCRRAERLVVALIEEMPIDPLITKYMNRLSDFLFVYARFIAKELGVSEKIWIAK